jgi:hypothetical protein
MKTAKASLLFTVPDRRNSLFLSHKNMQKSLCCVSVDAFDIMSFRPYGEKQSRNEQLVRLLLELTC